MKKFFLIALILLTFETILFGINIFINIYDNSLIINKDIFPIEGKPIPFRGSIKFYFKGINLPNADIPSNLLVLEDGQTIGVNGTIKVPNEVFLKLLDMYQANLIDHVIIDYYPIEIYQDKIIVKDYTERKKVKEYLDIFLDTYEIPNVNILYGEYDITPEPPKIKLTTFIFPDYGYYNVRIEDRSKVSVKTYVNGIISASYGTLEPGTYTFFISAIDELGLESTLTKNLFVPKSEINFKSEFYELGSLTKFGILNFVGNRNFYELSTKISTITNVIVKDTTKPTINVTYENLFNGYYSINVKVKDNSSVNLKMILNNREIESGIINLDKEDNTLIVYAEDGFSNISVFFKKFKINKLVKPGLNFFDRKKWINIGGIMIQSPYIFTWINSEKKRWINGNETDFITIHP
ncbi:MAG: hypothetical protein H0Z24_10130 [Thermosipho sp. (in: Bacteria)]|nr:hypothetical protein [Thermosipho sp. (in: thermotogales)]